MARLSMNEMTTYRWSFEEDVHHYRAAGFHAIGIWRRKLSDFGEEKGIELLLDSGLKVSNLLWAGGFTGSDGHSFRESIEDASEAIQLAGAMKAECLVVYSGARAGHTHNHARRLTAEALRELVPLADELGVTLALEPMHPGCAAEWTFLTSLDDAMALIQSIGNSRLKLAFDTYHWATEDALSRIAELTPQIAIVHLGDARQRPQHEQNRCRLGEGNLPLKEVIAALNNSGYSGYFDVELIGEELEASDYQDLLRHSREAFCQLVSAEA